MTRLVLPNFCSYQILFALLVYTEVIAFLFAFSNGGLGFWERLSYSSTTFAMIVVFTSAILCMRRTALNGYSLNKQVVHIIITTYFITYLVVKLNRYFFPSTDADYTFLLTFYLITITVITIVLLRILYYQQRWYAQEKNMHTAKIAALQDRIRPHFLFNCLNCLSQLIVSDKNKANKAVYAMAELFRYAIHPKPKISLEDELHLVEQYLFLEKIRLEERLTFKILCSDTHKQYILLELLIQPLVENAIKHGVEPSVSGGSVEVSVKENMGMLMIQVENSAGRNSAKNSSGNHYALKNLSERLKISYGNKAKLHFHPMPNKTIVSISIPIVKLQKK